MKTPGPAICARTRRVGRVLRGSYVVCLACVVDYSGLANDGDFDLPRILERLLDLTHDVSCQARGREIIYLVRLHQDTHLASSLDGVGFLDPLERIRHALERFQALDVGFDHLASCPRARA